MLSSLAKLFCRAKRLDMDSPSPSVLPLERWVEPPVWTESNEQAWREFLATPTGVALLHRGRAIAFNHAALAIQGSDVRANGFAAGFNAAIQWLPSLAISQPSAALPTDNSAEPPGAEEYGVRYAP